jgi:hypothetical protein
MAEHPITVPRDRYNGKDERRRSKAQAHNEAADRCETYINSDFLKRGQPRYMYSYGLLAIELKLSVDAVRDALNGPGGHNGITISKPHSDGIERIGS